jgi:CRP/FNR family transcriptional regulator, cyclic AMP receptor protein
MSHVAPAFDPEAFLDEAGVPRTVIAYEAGQPIYTQGDACENVLYIKAGEVKLSVTSVSGEAAVVAVLCAGNFFGEGALAGQLLRIESATAHTDATIIAIDTTDMRRWLHEKHSLSDRFIRHLLTRNLRMEEALVDQLFDSEEKRLARALLLLARYGDEHPPERVIPTFSPEALAEMVGTTRPRVEFFMNQFEALGFIALDGGLTVHRSLLSVVLQD